MQGSRQVEESRGKQANGNRLRQAGQQAERCRKTEGGTDRKTAKQAVRG